MMEKAVRRTPTGQDISIRAGYLIVGGEQMMLVDETAFGDYLMQGRVSSIRVESLTSKWTETNWIDMFTKVVSAINPQMTLRREIRSGKGHWYAYRRVGGHLYKRYVGSDLAITETRLANVARSMPG